MQTWLRIWSILTVAATVVLLAMGARVTSIRAGMADPVWPTPPWQLAKIDWNEPSHGFIVEHSHRLAGFIVGGLVSVLAIMLWWTESNRSLRVFGVLALVGLLGAYGYLHGVLIQQTKELVPGTPLHLPPSASMPMVLALAATFAVGIRSALIRTSGWGTRLLGIALLIGVMIQGLLGGLRVERNALWLAIVHAGFAQAVFSLTVVIALLLQDRRPVSSAAWVWVAVFAVFAQIISGAILRHLNSATGGRLHLMLAFVATISVVAASRVQWRSAKLWSVIALGLVALQIGFGVESWLSRYSDGFIAASLKPITPSDALLRTTHAVVGYLLFAATIALAFRNNATLRTPSPEFQLEGVA